MTPKTRKVIAIMGATGRQGGSLARSILSDKEHQFAVRALTRDPTKDAAAALKKAGAEVVKFDIDDSSTHGVALRGAYGVFAVTNFFEHFDTNKEIEQAKTIAEAAKLANVEHIVWSTMENSRPFFDSLEDDVPDKEESSGGWYIQNTDGKGYANRFFPKEKTTFFHTSMFLDNLYSFGMIQKGVFPNNMGDRPLAVIAAEDVGRCVHGIFRAGDEYRGEKVFVVGAKVTCAELMKSCSEVIGKEFVYAPMDRKTYASLGFPGATSIANYFDYHKRCREAMTNRSLHISKRLNPHIMDVTTWAKVHKEELLKLAGDDQIHV